MLDPTTELLLRRLRELGLRGKSCGKSRIKIGHDMLVSIAQIDFGYDLHAWHAYLKESRDGGYTWGRNIVLARIMMAALASGAWQTAVRQLAEIAPTDHPFV